MTSHRFATLLLITASAACSGVTVESTDTSDAAPAAFGGGAGVSGAGGSAGSGTGGQQSPPDQPIDAGPADWQTCAGPGDCELVLLGCCQGFAVPEYFEAANRARAAQRKAAHCPSLVGVGCDASLVPFGGLDAFCIAGTCQVVSLAADPISACTSDADCVAVASRCAQYTVCYGADYVRADQLATYAAQVCDAGSSPSRCEQVDSGPYASGVRCGATHHCESTSGW